LTVFLFFIGRTTGPIFAWGSPVGKKLGNAVKRNRLRRRIRGCITKVLGGYAAGYDLVFVARQGLGDLAFDQILKAVSRALQRSAIIDQRAEGNRQ
jgi:ribonuclease P protein component